MTVQALSLVPARLRTSCQRRLYKHSSRSAYGCRPPLVDEVTFSMTALLVFREATLTLLGCLMWLRCALHRCAVHAVLCMNHVICFVCCAMLKLWLAPAALHEHAKVCYVVDVPSPRNVVVARQHSSFDRANSLLQSRSAECCALLGPAQLTWRHATAAVWHRVEHELVSLFERRTCRSQTFQR